MRLLLLDIETGPSLGYIWGLWQNDVSLSQLKETGTVLCWSAKWVGEDKMFFSSIHEATPKRMLKKIHKLLCEADAVITFNGISFDQPILNREFLEYELGPPSPYASIDLMLVAKKKFRFISNKLEYIVKRLKIGEKMQHEGFDLWKKCLAGNEDAWRRMRLYNMTDTQLLEPLYLRFLPWISNHPNVGLRDGMPEACPNCGGTILIGRGMAFTKMGRYQRYVCKACGSWTRSGKRTMLATHSQIAS